MRILLLVCQLIFIGAASAQSVTGPEYPNRPIKQIVPFAPGGAVDIVTRIVASKWQDFLGQPMVVENKSGAGGTVGAAEAAKAPADGYTVFSCGVASHGVSPALFNQLGYDAIRDFAPISLIGKTPNVLVVHPSVPARTLAEFVQYVKARPGKLNYGSPGHGTSAQMTMELFKLTTGLDLVHVPYKGGAPALAGVMAAEVTGMFGNLPEQVAAIKGGRTRALAVSTLQRNAQLPDVPTVAESGFSGFEVTVWYAACARAGTAKSVLAKLHATLLKTLALPEMRARLAEASVEVTPTSPEEMAAFVRTEIDKWTRVVREGNIPKQN